MAKILKNENESPEVDLNNLTVKLAGMGLDEEIEDMIPGKKAKKSKKSQEDDSVDEQSGDDSEEKELEELEAEGAEDEEEAPEEESEDVKAFYDKRAAERDMDLEKVEQIANEMDALDDESDSESKKEKKTTVAKIKKERKKAKVDAFGIIAISLAIVALLAGGFYLYLSTRKEADLGLSHKEFVSQYYKSAIYTNNISKMGYTLTTVDTIYRDQENLIKSTRAEGEPAAITTVDSSAYKYFDYASYCQVNNQTIDFFPSVYVTGRECKESGNMKAIRFVMMTDNGDWEFCKVLFSAYLQAFLPNCVSDECLQKVENAIAQSNMSSERAILIKDGDIAYSVSINDFMHRNCYVMDVIPADDASEYVYYDSILGE